MTDFRGPTLKSGAVPCIYDPCGCKNMKHSVLMKSVYMKIDLKGGLRFLHLFLTLLFLFADEIEPSVEYYLASIESSDDHPK